MHLYTQCECENPRLQNIFHFSQIIAAIDKDLAEIEVSIASLNTKEFDVKKIVSDIARKTADVLNEKLAHIDKATYNLQTYLSDIAPSIPSKTALYQNQDFQTLNSIYEEMYSAELCDRNQLLTEEELPSIYNILKSLVETSRNTINRLADSTFKEMTEIYNDQLTLWKVKRQSLTTARNQTMKVFKETERALTEFDAEDNDPSNVSMKYPAFGRLYQKITLDYEAQSANILLDSDFNMYTKKVEACLAHFKEELSNMAFLKSVPLN